MKGLLLTGIMKNRYKTWKTEFNWYSAMSHKPLPLVKVGSDDQASCNRHLSPFWTVMLVGRDASQMVNMAPYMEEYSIPHAVAKHNGVLTPGSWLSAEIPFLSNTRDLVAGELLALPFDGGHKSIFCEKITPLK